MPKRLKISTPILIVILASCSLLFMGYLWLKPKVSWEETEKHKPYSKKALQNPYLALGRYITALGVDAAVHTDKRLLANLSPSGEDLPAQNTEHDQDELGPHDTLLMVDARGSLTQERSEKLMRWVEDGGTLIYSINNPYLGESFVYDYFMVEYELDMFDFIDEPESALTFIDEQESETQEDEESSDDAESADAEEIEVLLDDINGFAQGDTCPYSEEGIYFYRTDAGSDSQALELAFMPWPYMQSNIAPDVESIVSDGDKILFAEFARGQGRISFINNTSIWENQSVQCLDHALFFSQLADPRGNAWIIINYDAPSLWRLMWQKAPYVIFLFCLSFALWLWHKMVRFGPVYHPKELARRSFSEHLHSSALLLWRYKKQKVLLEQLRDDVSHKLKLRHLHFGGLDENEKINFLVEITRFDRVAIYQAMFKPLDDTLRFVEVISYLKEIKESA